MAGLRDDDLEDVAFHPWSGVKDVMSHRFMLPLALAWAWPAGTPLYFLLAPIRESNQMKNAIERL